ncbi:MAG TPA: DUF4175 family protein [Ohtaekwangia sp.]|nr:DUF4175 family protein [Ohtaekwangia sp.]
MGSGVERVQEKIKSFKKKYYLNIFVRGLILSLSILLGYFLLAAVIEHNLWLDTWMRLLIFATFFVVAFYCIYKFLREPLQWWFINRGLNEEESATIIGRQMPTVKDRLLNFIQLSALKNDSLAYASLHQKAIEFEPVSFEGIIDLKGNKKYLKFLLVPLLLIILILLINGSIITQSTVRLVNFNKAYSPKAPFNFIVENNSLDAYYNEDFTLHVKITGSALPQDVYLTTDNQRFKIETKGDGNFEYTFDNLQGPVTFQLEAAGFFSDPYEIALHNRPELTQFKIALSYPRYVQRENEELINAGNLEIPEGTIVTWKLSTTYADRASIQFQTDSSQHSFQMVNDQTFMFKKQIRNTDQYRVWLQNENSINKDKIQYSIDVIKDQYPTVSVTNLEDSILYKRVMLGGIVGDDYGLSHLALHYNIKDQRQKVVLSKTIPIPIVKNQLQQSFYYNWSLDSLQLRPNTTLEYYLQVWDNDGINGKKSSKTSVYNFLVPSAESLVAEIKRSQNQTEKQIDQSVGKAQKLQDQIENANQKLKGKQNLNWQDKKMLEDIIQQKNTLAKEIEKLREENKLLEEKKEAFTEQNERIREKAVQIQKLMDELLDDETKKLFEELQRLLKENTDVNDLTKLMNKLNQNTQNLEKELERALQLFKELQYDYKMDQAIKNLDDQIQKQKSLLEKTESLEQQNNRRTKENKEEKEAASKKQSESLAREQEKLIEEQKDNDKALDELEKLGEELHKNENSELKESMDEILQEQEMSKELLENNEPAKSKSPQNNSLQKMQQMKDQMQQSQSSMEMEMEMENLESLRQIIHGLVKLSYDQEGLMKQFGELTPNDPRFNVIAQNQIKLKDDAKVLEDSLLALGKRDPFMGSIVTKEVSELNNHLDRVIESNKERRKPQASTEMQASMASINNLALMLDNHFEMMMQMMANAKPSNKGKNKPSLSQMQQRLNQKIEQLKNSGKSGRPLSEELAEMAAEQERIRKALQEMENKMKDGKLPGNIPGKMEQTEMDLVNKQLTDQLIKRQEDILTRLLESEKSMREQDLDEERKGETAKEYDKEIPAAFEEYLRLKEKEVELLKTVPPKLYPYYKKEVNEYFKRMGNQ